MLSRLEGMAAPTGLDHTPGGYRLQPMPHAPEDKRKALLRVRRIQGQTEALARALEAGEDCGPVLVQLAAIRGAVNGLMSEILQSHIREELGALPEADDRHARLAQDMTSLVRTYLK